MTIPKRERERERELELELELSLFIALNITAHSGADSNKEKRDPGRGAWLAGHSALMEKIAGSD